ncbi:hypothetical protein K505DRAFT_379661 [Melanomma pulvis-pyrius CBS 109.77]|uniref:Uncharacterized protein n=1 Tax=Melanomma pulvis-pyrius CBS 109.77 TaxID=1314802 RepID=A0A6A6WTE6_9PLEO|nr:hypothetical protein K505DRAFT_379661 [Melanomma pulvis-pyrius CBS 109.77]
MANTQTLAKHYTRLLTLWPKDLLRPNLPFTKTLEHRGLPFGVQPLSPSPTKAKPSPKTTAPHKISDPRTELANVNALFLLLENKFSKKYPLSQEVLKPKSNPGHYDRLMEEIERAPKKSWLSAVMDEWKMKIRWK